MSDTLLVARRYLSERYTIKRFVPLALIVAGAGVLASPITATAIEDARGALLAYLLVLVFRIWDDLEDRDIDARRHPERITVRIASRAPLAALAVQAAAPALIILISGPQPVQRSVALVILTAALFAWYRARGSSSIANALVVLAKYPVIACVAAPASLWEQRDLSHAAPALLTLYLLLCIHEALDDPILRRSLGRGFPT